MHQLDIDEGKVIILEQKRLVPNRLHPLFDHRVNLAFLIDLDPDIVLLGMSCSDRLDVTVDESHHYYWMQGQNAQVFG